MTDLHDRFATLDGLQPPSLWTAIEVRSVSARPASYGSLVPLLATVVIIVLAVALAATSIGSHAVAPGPTGVPASATILTHGTCAWRPTGSMTEHRKASSATLLLDGRVLVAGGLVNSSGITLAELYDPETEAWTATGAMSEGRAYHSAVVLHDGRVLVFGGVSFSNDGTDHELASAEIYDPRTGLWASTLSMAEARSDPATVVLPDGRVLAAGGWGSTERFGPKLATSEVYDPDTGVWSSTGRMSTGRVGADAILLRTGLVLVPGGYGENRLSSAEIYDPTRGVWAATGDLPEPFLGYTAGLLSDGHVLIAGGDVPSGPGAGASDHAALLDPSTGAWTLSAPMLHARLGPSGVVLPDGRFFVTGDTDSNGDATEMSRSTEVYDPLTGEWSASEPMAVPRGGHSMTLLRDGRVLVAGGTSSLGELLSSAELCVPG